MSGTSNWDYLAKRLIWDELPAFSGRVLDFGSGSGETAAHLSESCEVTAVEPDAAAVSGRADGDYTQLLGGVELLSEMPDRSFDAVICHNVLEYVPNGSELSPESARAAVLRELSRLLKPVGLLSIVKHNRVGRVMQKAVLLDELEEAAKLLDGKNSGSALFGTINYYDDGEIASVCPELELIKVYGLRTFFDLQQKQEKHSDPDWRERMLALERKVSVLPEFQTVSFFHHLIYKKGKY